MPINGLLTKICIFYESYLRSDYVPTYLYYGQCPVAVAKILIFCSVYVNRVFEMRMVPQNIKNTENYCNIC